jgi:hypothetical protein
MATVERSAGFADPIDELLDYLWAEWDAVGDLAAQWCDWSPYERVDFAAEWPIREDRLDQLVALNDARALTPGQRERYRRLLNLVAQRRPILNELFQAEGLPSSAATAAPPP